MDLSLDSGIRFLMDNASKRTKKNTITATNGLMMRAKAMSMSTIIGFGCGYVTALINDQKGDKK